MGRVVRTRIAPTEGLRNESGVHGRPGPRHPDRGRFIKTAIFRGIARLFMKPEATLQDFGHAFHARRDVLVIRPAVT